MWGMCKIPEFLKYIYLGELKVSGLVWTGMLNWRAAAADLRAREWGRMSAHIPSWCSSPGPAVEECTGNPKTVCNVNPRVLGHVGWTGFRDIKTSTILCNGRKKLVALPSRIKALSAVWGARWGGVYSCRQNQLRGFDPEIWQWMSTENLLDTRHFTHMSTDSYCRVHSTPCYRRKLRLRKVM